MVDARKAPVDTLFPAPLWTKPRVPVSITVVPRPAVRRPRSDRFRLVVVTSAPLM